MQSNKKIADTSKTTVKEAILNHESNIQALYSGNSGTEFPKDPVAGTRCYREDTQTEYIYNGSEWIPYAPSKDIPTKLSQLADDIHVVTKGEDASVESLYITGETSVPTPNEGNNSKAIANTEFVQNTIAKVVDSAPETLNTLNELATALGNDPNFATTISKLIGEKESKTDANVAHTILQNSIDEINKKIEGKLVLTSVTDGVLSVE